MTMKVRGTGFRHRRQRQTGVVATLLAVIVLVATLLAAVALLRSVDTSNNIAGSLAFRQSVIQAGENAYQQAQTTTTFAEPTSDTDHANVGYYASLQVPTTTNTQGLPDVLVTQLANPTTFNNTTVQLTGLPAGYNGYYVVERLCPPGTTTANVTLCIVPGAVIQGGSSSNQTKDNGPPFSSGAYAAFRLTVGVSGPKNTIGYVQTVLR